MWCIWYKEKTLPSTPVWLLIWFVACRRYSKYSKSIHIWTKLLPNQIWCDVFKQQHKTSFGAWVTISDTKPPLEWGGGLYSSPISAALAALYFPSWVTDWVTESLMIINLSDPPMSRHYLTFLTKPLKSWEQISSNFRIAELFSLAVRILGHGDLDHQSKNAQNQNWSQTFLCKIEF